MFIVIVTILLSLVLTNVILYKVESISKLLAYDMVTILLVSVMMFFMFLALNYAIYEIDLLSA